MSELLHADPDAIETHAQAVGSIVSSELDGSAASIRETANMTHVFGLLCSPLLAPPLGLLALVADAQIGALTATGASIAAGLKGTAAVYRAGEEANSTLFGK